MSTQEHNTPRPERYITAPNGRRITESEWMSGGNTEWTDEFKQCSFNSLYLGENTATSEQNTPTLSELQAENKALKDMLYEMILKSSTWSGRIPTPTIDAAKDLLKKYNYQKAI